MPMSDSQLRDFLLRRLADADWERLAEAILLEDGLAERVRDEEFDLLDDYAAGRLNTQDRAAVQLHLLASAEGRRALRVARALRAVGASGAADLRTGAMAAPLPPGQTSSRTWSGRAQRVATVATFLAAGLVAVVLAPPWNIAPPIGPEPEKSAAVSSPGTAAQSPSLPDARDEGVQTISLLADIDRGAANQALKFEARKPTIRLQAEVTDADEQKLYWLRISDDSGHILFDSPPLTTRTAGRYRFVEVKLPASVLGSGVRSVVLRASAAADPASPLHRWEVVVSPE